MTENLRALILNCTLKPSPAPSSTEALAGVVATELRDRGCTVESLRVVDHSIHPGVERDMGNGDQWPEILKRVLESQILILATPTWVGQHSSVAQRVIERLDAELSETDAEGRPSLYDRIVIPVVVGNEDGAHHIVGIIAQALSDVGFVVPAQGGVYWNGEAMSATDFIDLDTTPDKVRIACAAAAANAAHLARLLRADPFPATTEPAQTA